VKAPTAGVLLGTLPGGKQQKVCLQAIANAGTPASVCSKIVNNPLHAIQCFALTWTPPPSSARRNT
jgi:hypothetical protein